MLTAVELGVSRSNCVIVNSASITVEEGAATVLLGPSGGGKTSLMRALSLLDPLERGYIELDGVRRKAESAENNTTYWPYVSPVFQQHFLWPHLCVEENIFIGTTELARRGCHIDRTVLATLELEHLLKRLPHELSVGQRQRVALARACARSPRFLLLDEITSSLDIEWIARVSEMLHRRLEAGLGLLIISHHMGFIRSLLTREADMVNFMDGGEIIESGGRAILTNPNSDRLSRFLQYA